MQAAGLEQSQPSDIRKRGVRMTKALYITADTYGVHSGGGSVLKHEKLALKSVFDSVTLLDSQDVVIPAYESQDITFLNDYWCLAKLTRHPELLDGVSLVHFYSGCFSETVKYLRARGIPVTYTCPAHDHRLSIEEFDRYAGGYPFPHIGNPVLYDQHLECLRHANMVIVPSTHSKRYLLEMGIATDIRVIPHGIESVPDQIAPYPEKFTVGYVGQMGPDKGLVYLIKAWGQLGYDDARLVLAGQHHVLDYLARMIRREAPKGKFVLLGEVPDVNVVYDACNICVFPSVTEGFGIGVIEAMSRGRPVIVSEGAGAADAIACGGGIRVGIRSHSDIRLAIDRYYHHPEEQADDGEIAQDLARRYTWGKVRAMYANVFKRFV